MQRVAFYLRWFAYGWAVLVAAVVVVNTAVFFANGAGLVGWAARELGWARPLRQPGLFLLVGTAVATLIVLAPPLLALHYADRIESADPPVAREPWRE